MLKSMTARQLGEWEQYACIEQVGAPPQHIESAEGKQKARRARVEGGFKTLMEKQGKSDG